MVAFAASDGSLELPDPLVRAVVRHAHRRAEWTIVALDATGLFESEAPQLPAGFLLELSAVVELAVWEHHGLREHLDVDLPTSQEALANLAARTLKGPTAFEGPNPAPLSSRVLQVWVERFAWDGPELLGADVVVGDFDDDELVEVLAELIWTNRHELAGFLSDEGDEQ